MGPPTFPETPIPTYEEFCADYIQHFWTHEDPPAGRMFIIVSGGEKVGCITQNEIVKTPDGRRAVELDIWLAGPEVLNRGYGRQALRAMCELVKEEFDVDVAFLQPSSRNEAACAAYAAAGFTRSPQPAAEAARRYRTRLDTSDAVFYVRELDSLIFPSPSRR